MNAKIVCLLVGLVAGALAGYLTRPQGAEISIGGLNLEVTGPGTAEGGGSLTSSQTQHIAILALIGAVVGFGIGFAADRRGS